MSVKSTTSNSGRLSERRGVHKLSQLDSPSSTEATIPRFKLHEISCLFDTRPPNMVTPSAIIPSSTSTPSHTRPTSTDNSPVMTMRSDVSRDSWESFRSKHSAFYGLGLECQSSKCHMHKASQDIKESTTSPSSSTIWEDEDEECECFENSPLDDSDPPMPPTPVSPREGDFCTLLDQSPFAVTQCENELYDREALSEPSAPTSPVCDQARLSRRTTVMKMLPQKLRPLVKRRSSSAHASYQLPIIPPISTMPTWNTRRSMTPPNDESDSYFTRRVPLQVNDSLSSLDDCTPYPPAPASSPTSGAVERPVTPGSSSSENFPEVITSKMPEPIRSPLPPAPISPLTTPSLPAPLQANLDIITPLFINPHHHQQVVPVVVGPASPAIILPGHRKTASIGNAPVTANSLADMIEQMQIEDDAFVVTEKHLIESGWSTPEEIESIRLQRRESKYDWQKRIEDAKQKLVDIRRHEVQARDVTASMIATGSATSIDSRLSH